MFENKKLLSGLIIVAGVCLSIFFLANAYGSLRGDAKDKPVATISVSGDGEYFAVPDTAMFTFTVQKDGATQKIAKDTGSEIMNKILDVLKKDYKMTDKELKNIDLSINPKYEYGPVCYGGYCPQTNPKITGYTFTNTVTVKISDLDKAGEISSKLAELGATNVSGPNFSLKNEDDAKNQARTDAINKAKEKAKVLADQLGVKLGKIQSFSENNGGGVYPMYDSAMVSSFATKSVVPQLPAGENKYSSNVTITYEIK
jgi:uncharacterized protein YggE